MLLVPWSLCIGVLAGSHILAELKGKKSLTFLTKPLTMVLIIAMMMTWTIQGDLSYRNIVLAGLLFSLAGDVFLMQRKEKFIQGLSSFLIAHLFYIYAFTRGGWVIDGVVALILLSLAGLFIYFLRNKLGSLFIAVLLYATAILTMGIVAISAWLHRPESAQLAAAVGAVLFIISDGFLAIRKFRGAYKWSPLCVMSTYFCAQWLIALSAILKL